MTSTIDKYKNTYAYKTLIKNHKLDSYGVWEIRGEDPNCDWGGAHYNPYIATVEGRLKDVIEVAVVQPNFWTWGAGGTISKVDIKPVDELISKESIKQKALAKLTKLEKEVLGIK